ncbi:MAG: adenylate kinase [Deltaproteobacteria bacterium]|nr:adenylate kinase [Deltaproteobacteria bacterium]
MRVIFIGLPGSGKGTQSESLSKHWDVPKITTGDLLRKEIQEKTQLGLKIKSTLEAGSLASDETVLEVMTKRMSEPDCKNGFILDGFPRTIPQAEGLSQWLRKREEKINFVLAMELDPEVAVVRNAGRRQCPSCGIAYHLQFRPSKKEGVCDRCGAALVQRKDDHPDTIRKRLKIYADETSPLLQYYEGKKMLRVIDASKSAEDIFQTILSLR